MTKPAATTSAPARRSSYTVANLRLNVPVVVSINSKSDGGLSWDCESIYWYGQFLFMYCGEFEHIQLGTDSEPPISKPIPWQSARQVDLNERLL